MYLSATRSVDFVFVRSLFQLLNCKCTILLCRLDDNIFKQAHVVTENFDIDINLDRTEKEKSGEFCGLVVFKI